MSRTRLTARSRIVRRRRPLPSPMVAMMRAWMDKLREHERTLPRIVVPHDAPEYVERIARGYGVRIVRSEHVEPGTAFVLASEAETEDRFRESIRPRFHVPNPHAVMRLTGLDA